MNNMPFSFSLNDVEAYIDWCHDNQIRPFLRSKFNIFIGWDCIFYLGHTYKVGDILESIFCKSGGFMGFVKANSDFDQITLGHCFLVSEVEKNTFSGWWIGAIK